jgi:hypothetical protein
MLDPADWPLLALLVLPLGIAGLVLRARGRRSLARVSAAGHLMAGGRLRDLAPGVVAFLGTWRAVAGERGVVEDEDGAAVVIGRGAGASPIADGARVLCHGVAGGDVPDPRGGGYRGVGRLRLVDASGAGDFVTTDVDRWERARRVGRRDAIVGALLVALSVAVVAAAMALWLQARDQAF